MTSYVVPALVTLVAWWIGTGVILYLDSLPRRTYRWSMAGATLVLGMASLGLFLTRDSTTSLGAYGAFACSMLVWAWVEMSFLMGYVTGPRTTACPPESKGWERARHAFETIAYHECALLAGGALIAAMTLGGENLVGAWTYAILWVMRLSAKLNVFFGVRNLSEEFLPPHLRYLQSYFRRRPMNAFFPIAVSAATVAAVILWQSALGASASEFERTAHIIAASLLTLAVLEHLLLVLPLSANGLWQWSLRSQHTK